MTQSMTLVLPMLAIPDTAFDAPGGALVLPGQSIAQKEVVVELDVVNKCLTAARRSAENAYAPYSKFNVGAAVVMADDPAQEVRTGVNVENSSYGLTVCAERACLFSAVTAGFRTIRYLAVSTVCSLDGVLPERMPCGACRQAIQEFSGNTGLYNETLVLVDSARSDVVCEFFDMARLMAYGFHMDGAGNQ